MERHWGKRDHWEPVNLGTGTRIKLTNTSLTIEHFYKNSLSCWNRVSFLIESQIEKGLKLYIPQGQRRITLKRLRWRLLITRTTFEHRLPSYRKLCSCSSSSYCIIEWLLFYCFRYLDNNELKEISSDAFDGLKNLQSL